MPLGNWSPTLAVYGDLGETNSRSLPILQELAQNGELDAILHVGDFAYDLHSLQGIVGDLFMRDIEPIAAYVPYMTAVGNHEQAYNFSHYKNRFSMPANDNFYYAFNLGSACFVALSTEFYFVDLDLAKKQYDWLTHTLLDNNCSWLLTYGHRPMYCSSLNHNDCTKNNSIIRTNLEELFYNAGVDVAIWAHEHNYERTYPVYQGRVYPANKAPVHIISGSAGCREDHDPIKGPRGPWSAYRSKDYGFGLLTILNNTHIYWEQISVDATPAQVIDSLYFVK
uniref:Calcineurin-like phosphoesterase n=1 Tax=Marseillevirus LCMAC202 TaxID=2506606 RepID=A0A481YYB5_9VIRU|nr:MAG: calcineurin-like phosphoesterase [Marseillevirus LCMAC202]